MNLNMLGEVKWRTLNLFLMGLENSKMADQLTLTRANGKIIRDMEMAFKLL